MMSRLQSKCQTLLNTCIRINGIQVTVKEQGNKDKEDNSSNKREQKEGYIF